jgi:hypothetical protein
MTPLYKEGLYWLSLLAVTAVLYGVLVLFIGPARACGAFGLMGLFGLSPLFYRKRGQNVVMDERDTQIALGAAVAGFSACWLVFTLANMGVWSVVFGLEGQSTVSVHVLPNILWICFIVVMTARASFILVAYHLQDAGKGE